MDTMWKARAALVTRASSERQRCGPLSLYDLSPTNSGSGTDGTGVGFTIGLDVTFH